MYLKNKKFLIISLLTCTTLLFLHCILCLSYISLPNKCLWEHNCIEKKVVIANKVKDNKIVILAGSNAFFGLNTKCIQKELGKPCINVATHAGLGNYIFHYGKKTLRKGDVVILPLEYEYYTTKLDDISSTELFYMLTYDKKYFYNLPLNLQIKMLLSISPSDIFQALKDKEQSSNEKVLNIKTANAQELTYNSNYMDENGDIIYNIGHTESAFANVAPFSILPSEKFDSSLNMSTVKDFTKWCQINRIKVYITYPNTIYFKEYKNPKYKKFFNDLDTYLEENNIKVIGTPYDAMFDEKLFFDTMYHLNQDGVSIRTQKFINLIKANHIDSILKKK